MSNLETLTSAIARWTSSERRWRVTFIGLVAVGSGVFFFAMGWRVLGVAHPADDAYILFRYVQNAAAGLGIVFNAGGPRTEGATDFLWLVLLIGAVRRGLTLR